MSIFEKATRQKLRFASDKGLLSVEDLWDLKLEQLDKLAIGVNNTIKETSQESFIKKRTTASTVLELKLDILKHVIEVKQKEEEDKLLAKEKKEKREKLLVALEKIEDRELQSKSADEIRKELAEL